MGPDTSRERRERTSFVGRDRELSSLRGLLGGGTRLLTLTGPSGMGKTRLARRVLRKVDVPACVIGIRACRNQAQLRAAVADGLGLEERRGGSFVGSLAARGPLLLVLDGAEPAARALAPVIEEWLDRCPELRLLVTSLVPLGVKGEVRFELGPLDEADAVDLYLERAREAWADRAFTASDREPLGMLVTRLDRVPLAIELAAARVRVLSPKLLLERIDQRLDLLRSGESSLAQALSLSWNLLTPAEQLVLARASVFVGTFTLEAAEAILGDAIVDRLDGLREKALLQLEGDRFSMYESIRAFAARQLGALGGEEEIERLHAHHFARTGEAWAARVEGPDAGEALRWLAAERDNLLAAHHRSFAIEPGISARSGIAIAALFTRGGPASFEREILDGTVQAARRDGDPALLARALWERGRIFKRGGEVASARRDLDEGLTVSRGGPSEGALLVASAALRVPAAEPEARDEIERALILAREQGDRYLEGQALLVLGALEESRGALDASARWTEEALVVFRQGRFLRYCGVALLNLGSIRSHRGRFSAARQALEEACRIFGTLENVASLAYATVTLGTLSLAMGDLDEAERHLLSYLSIDRRSGNRLLHGIATGHLGILSFERGELREADRRIADGVATLRELGAQRHWASLLPFHAAVLAELGRGDEARLEIEEARAAFGEVDDPASGRMVSLLEGIVELSAARRGGDMPSIEARVRARLGETSDASPATVEGLFVARRLLEKTLAQLFEGPVVQPIITLRIGPDAAWFALGSGTTVDLRKRSAVRRILRGLVENRLSAPGAGTSSDELSAIGWPGEKILPTAAGARVWSAIRILRSLGLADVLLRHADGYLLDPELAIAPPVETTSHPAGRSRAAG